MRRSVLSRIAILLGLTSTLVLLACQSGSNGDNATSSPVEALLARDVPVVVRGAGLDGRLELRVRRACVAVGRVVCGSLERHGPGDQRADGDQLGGVHLRHHRADVDINLVG